jgi:hypothetical protein
MTKLQSQKQFNALLERIEREQREVVAGQAPNGVEDRRSPKRA